MLLYCPVTTFPTLSLTCHYRSWYKVCSKGPFRNDIMQLKRGGVRQKII